ncbi:hypothetical protein [Roseomonas sp. 18066]|uniref:hypothetical protein n=1 Tax=Roseomonas sp. 18066 TaxID=2681412 RepID=UPI001357B3A0|nr:hypothetical protein [Roseomonas sp. 18066]
MPAPAAVLDDLRAQLARIEQGNTSISVSPLSLGFSLDRHLPGGGLARGALHEVQAADVGAGLAFCALLLMRTRGTVLWISPRSPSRSGRPGFSSSAWLAA